MSPGERYLFYSITAADGETLLLVVTALSAEDFDQYMAEVAQPIIDSIQFRPG